MRVRATSTWRATGGAIAAIGLAAAGVSACSSGSTTSAGSTGGTTSARVSGITLSAGTVCTLVPASQVAAVARDKVANANGTQVQSADPASYLCSYNLDNGNNVQVEVEVISNASAFDASELGLTGGGYAVTSISGIGENAAASSQGIVVRTSKYIIEITNVPDQAPPYTGDKTLAESVVGGLA